MDSKTKKYLWFGITFNMDAEMYKFRTTGNTKRDGIIDIIDSFLRGQQGKGADLRNPNMKKVYHIKVKWYPENDDIVVTSDTGNDGLRDGILNAWLVWDHARQKKSQGKGGTKALNEAKRKRLLRD